MIAMHTKDLSEYVISVDQNQIVKKDRFSLTFRVSETVDNRKLMNIRIDQIE
jgi:hypothetical protein